MRYVLAKDTLLSYLPLSISLYQKLNIQHFENLLASHPWPDRGLGEGVLVEIRLSRLMLGKPDDF